MIVIVLGIYGYFVQPIVGIGLNYGYLQIQEYTPSDKSFICTVKIEKISNFVDNSDVAIEVK